MQFSFSYIVKTGKNVVRRNSRSFRWNTNDATPSSLIYKNITDALEGNQEFVMPESELPYGFPDRFVLPKGRKGGMPYNLYVIISPFMCRSPCPPEGQVILSDKVGTGSRLLDGLPMGYPLDREILSENIFTSMQNMHFESVVIFHKKDSEINETD